jgi:hypothetical protein
LIKRPVDAFDELGAMVAVFGRPLRLLRARRVRAPKRVVPSGDISSTHLPLLDPGTNNEVTFVVAWSAVAVGIITPSLTHGESPGQYA